MGTVFIVPFVSRSMMAGTGILAREYSPIYQWLAILGLSVGNSGEFSRVLSDDQALQHAIDT